MLRSLHRAWHLILLSLTVTLLVLNSVGYANEETIESAQEDTTLSLEADVVVVPDLLTQSVDIDDDEQAPSMALVPAPPLEPPPLKTLTLMLDWYLSPQHAALVVAKERGLYAAHGLDVDIQSPADPSIAIKLLSAGDVDLALTRQPLLHLYAHEGAPITRIATLIETPLTAVVVMGQETLESEHHLAGLQYGYTTREGLDLLIPRLVPRSVQEIDDYSAPTNLHFDPARALREGQADAVADGYFHYLPPQLAAEGIATHLIRFDTLDIPRHDGLIVVANSDSLVRRADTWSRFVLALEEASHWIIDNPTQAWQLLVSSHPVLDNDINTAAWEDIVRRIALSPAALDSRRYTAFEAYLLERTHIETTLPLSRLAVDPHALL